MKRVATDRSPVPDHGVAVESVRTEESLPPASTASGADRSAAASIPELKLRNASPGLANDGNANASKCRSTLLTMRAWSETDLPQDVLTLLAHRLVPVPDRMPLNALQDLVSFRSACQVFRLACEPLMEDARLRALQLGSDAIVNAAAADFAGIAGRIATLCDRHTFIRIVQDRYPQGAQREVFKGIFQSRHWQRACFKGGYVHNQKMFDMLALALAAREQAQLHGGEIILDLRCANLRDNLKPLLAEALQDRHRITELYLRENWSHQSMMEELIAMLGQNTVLRCLDLDGQELRGKAEALITALLPNTSLQTLKLRNTSLTRRNLLPLARLLAQHRFLQELDLNGNYFDTDGMQIIAKGLAQNSTLQVLRMGHNESTAKGAQALVSAVRGRATPLHLELNNAVAGFAAHPGLQSLPEDNPLVTISWQHHPVNPRNHYRSPFD